MSHNFDRVPSRRKTNALNRWTWYPKEVIPLWIADMDFPAPPPILQTLHKAVDHGVLGYELGSKTLRATVAARMWRLHRWKVTEEMVVPVAGAVTGFDIAARTFCTPGRGYLIQPPVYNQFLDVGSNVGVPQIDAPMVKNVEGSLLRYEIEWQAFEAGARQAAIFILCNPHNPLGMVFTRSELTRMAEICLENDVMIVSDEIHAELMLGDQKFRPVASLAPEVAENTITLVSASKAFNVPGLFCAFAIIPNPEIREKYMRMTERLRVHVNNLGLSAAQAAFSGKCDQWLKECRRYLKNNRDMLVDYVVRFLPGMRVTVPEATYLAWLDCTQLELRPNAYEFFLKEAKVALSDGATFGTGGEGCVRMNFGSTRRTVRQALTKMRKALLEK